MKDGGKRIVCHPVRQDGKKKKKKKKGRFRLGSVGQELLNTVRRVAFVAGQPAFQNPREHQTKLKAKDERLSLVCRPFASMEKEVAWFADRPTSSLTTSTLQL